MKTTIIATAFVAALAAPAAASTVLDFTTSGIGTGNTTGSAANRTYEITGSGTLTDATHKTNVGCTGEAWEFTCDAVDNRFDVGFGVQGGGNDNEVDGMRNGVNKNEYVQVKFGGLVKILGFAGMLTYDDSQSDGTETVVLEYSKDGGATFSSVFASAINDDNDPYGTGTDNNLFNTVGLAFAKDLSLLADVVRFRAGGVSPYDDGNANITAAGLEVGVVPVPAALPLLLAGVGALGWASRRKRQLAG
ncbi:VPLPA-CTERM sorting domain-containing protein [Palleronia sp. KMU-117]|uniref:VPLPA-CTERM sorting domain-containing protein n=1 Tax=Palleronia sp. KMU-117 TaxID=3434108 RepID=UPI003D709774